MRVGISRSSPIQTLRAFCTSLLQYCSVACAQHESPACPHQDGTDEGHVGDTGFAQAVAMADVNGDGALDIFVTNSQESNILFVNIDGSGKFEVHLFSA